MAQETTTQTTFSVPDISCTHCEQVITRTLTQVPGVGEVNVDIPTRQVRVEFDPTQVDVEQMAAALAEEEYPVAGIVAADAAFETGTRGASDIGCSCCSPAS